MIQIVNRNIKVPSRCRLTGKLRNYRCNVPIMLKNGHLIILCPDQTPFTRRSIEDRRIFIRNRIVS